MMGNIFYWIVFLLASVYIFQTCLSNVFLKCMQVFTSAILYSLSIFQNNQQKGWRETVLHAISLRNGFLLIDQFTN